MKKGRCPKCGSKDVRTRKAKSTHQALQITSFRGAYLQHYVCVACGCVEAYIADEKHLKMIADKWKPE